MTSTRASAALAALLALLATPPALAQGAREGNPGGSYAVREGNPGGSYAVREGNPGGSYVVRRGQTLSTVAHDVLGDPRLWPAIYRANRDQIKDPTLLHVGQRLAIPEVPADPETRERIRAEALAWAAPARGPEGPDVAAARPPPASSATE